MMRVTHSLIAVWFCLALYSIGVQGLDKFEPQCQGDNDYGWPRFHFQEELEASPWSSYFMDVYGEIPSQYPVCIYDLWTLDRDAYENAKITGHEVVSQSQVKSGDLYEFAEGSVGNLSYGIYHSEWEPLADNTWVEIAHTAVPTEMEGFWVIRARGSGIWYNTGKTIVFPTPSNMSRLHMDAILFLMKNCSKNVSFLWPQIETDIFGFCAREKGFDSVQFRPQEGEKPVGTFGIDGAMEMVFSKVDGKYACGVEDGSKTPFRQGWMASKQCVCMNEPMKDSCGLVKRMPPPTSGPVCKWNLKGKDCDPLTCQFSRCAVHGRTATLLFWSDSLYSEGMTIYNFERFGLPGISL